MAGMLRNTGGLPGSPRLTVSITSPSLLSPPSDAQAASASARVATVTTVMPRRTFFHELIMRASLPEPFDATVVSARLLNCHKYNRLHLLLRSHGKCHLSIA